MSRPSFQFYPGDWQKNANLRRCSPAARGAWIDILCLLHDAEAEYGVLRWPLKDIANAASAPMSLVKELVTKGVLKGADKGAEPYVYRPKHAGKEGPPVILVAPLDGPVWYSSRFVRDEYVRQRRGESTRFDTENQPPSRSPKGGIGERQGDGPSSSSSPSGSEAKASAGADAPPPVDKSTNAEERRQLWADSGTWLVSNGLTASDAKAFMNTLAKDFPAVVADALREAVKEPAPVDVKAYAMGIAKRLSGERQDPVTAPSDAAAKTQADLAALDEQTRRARTPEAQAARVAAMQRLGRAPATEVPA